MQELCHVPAHTADRTCKRRAVEHLLAQRQGDGGRGRHKRAHICDKKDHRDKLKHTYLPCKRVEVKEEHASAQINVRDK